MQSAEDFVAEFIRESGLMVKKELDWFEPFCRKFYTEDYSNGFHRLEYLKSQVGSIEKIVRVLNSEKDTHVITAKDDGAGTSLLIRYVLVHGSGGWLIKAVEIQCPFCYGKPGNLTCVVCDGNGWFDISAQNLFKKDWTKLGSSPPTPPKNPPPPHRRF